MSVGLSATDAFVLALGDLLEHGQLVEAPTTRRLELRNRTTVILAPRRRVYLMPRRLNNVFATIAESLWVLAGRNDIAFLAPYLPRAPQFSDDGETWRGGYGPRLRDWRGVDQLHEVVSLLRRKPYSRKAIISLFDPARDFVESVDIPCHNWLHPMVEDDVLTMQIVNRSNDLIWGFSGINTFEWSLVQELLARSIGVDVGPSTTFTTTLHIYDRHFDRAPAILSSFPGVSCYDFEFGSPPLESSIETIDARLAQLFEDERRVRLDGRLATSRSLGDAFLDTCLRLLKVYLAAQAGATDAQLARALSDLEESDLSVAAVEHLSRQRPSLLEQLSLSEAAQAFLGQLSTDERVVTPWVARRVVSLLPTFRRGLAGSDPVFTDSVLRAIEATTECVEFAPEGLLQVVADCGALLLDPEFASVWTGTCDVAEQQLPEAIRTWASQARLAVGSHSDPALTRRVRQEAWQLALRTLLADPRRLLRLEAERHELARAAATRRQTKDQVAA